MQIKKGTIDNDGLAVIDGKKYATGENLYLDGENVGRFHFMKNGNYVLVLNGWPEYKRFAEAISRSEVQLSADGETIIEVPFQDFEDHYLSSLEAVHADPISYLTREAEFPAGERMPEDFLKKFRKSGKKLQGNIIEFPGKH